MFLGDPDVAIDTNHLERALRPIPMGKKNWLFAWTEIGAERIGIIQSLLVTCRLQGVDPYTYLRQVLEQLPYADTVEKLEALLPWREQIRGEKSHQGSSIRALVIEDEPILLRTITDRLEDEGYRVRAEKDGTAGLGAWREEPFDIVILDLVMPGMGGAEAIRRLRSAHTELGIVHRKAGRFDEARQSYEAAIDIFPGDTQIATPQQAANQGG